MWAFMQLGPGSSAPWLNSAPPQPPAGTPWGSPQSLQRCSSTAGACWRRWGRPSGAPAPWTACCACCAASSGRQRRQWGPRAQPRPARCTRRCPPTACRPWVSWGRRTCRVSGMLVPSPAGSCWFTGRRGERQPHFPAQCQLAHAWGLLPGPKTQNCWEGSSLRVRPSTPWYAGGCWWGAGTTWRP